MPDMNVGNASVGDLTNTETLFSVDSQTTDAATESPETFYDNPDWEQELGYYKSIPELRQALDTIAAWTVGKGYKADDFNRLVISGIRGNGKDSFNSIMQSLVVTAKFGKDAFAEIIRDNEGKIINLKPLSTLRIVQNRQGLIIRYEQVSKVKGKGNLRFEPEDIFHISNRRRADEIHGESIVSALKEIILMRNEAMHDYKQLLHRHVKPRIVWKLDTDDASKIADFKAKADEATNNCENIYIPKDAAEHEILAIPTNATMNPLPWIGVLNNYFFQACGVPQIIVGGSQEITEATAKIAYLAFQQAIEEIQLYLEEQIKIQLGLNVEFEFPASLENELLASQKKEGTMQASTPEDTRVQGMPLNGSAA